jgi:hypothetical protein
LHANGPFFSLIGLYFRNRFSQIPTIPARIPGPNVCETPRRHFLASEPSSSPIGIQFRFLLFEVGLLEEFFFRVPASVSFACHALLDCRHFVDRLVFGCALDYS